MRITMSRWIAATVLGCAFVAVATLPSGPDADEGPSYRWQPQQHGLENRVSQRQRAVSGHARGLAAAYKSADDSAQAGRVFGPMRPNNAGPDYWFAPDVPERSRRAVMELIAHERDARREWRGRGPVGVMVVTDTSTTIDHVKLPVDFDRDRPLMTAVLPASSATGDRCVTVIRLRHTSLTAEPVMLQDRLPLDGCAFTDAFGEPGPKIAGWLGHERYLHARRLLFEVPRDEANLKRYAWDGGDVGERACRAGDDQACLAEVTHRDNRDYWMMWWGRDLSVAVPSESWETLSRIDFDTDVLLESLARDMGPSRFQRMWQSQKPLEDAYFDQTGESFAGWVRARLVRFYGPYRVGALPAPAANLLTVFVIVILAAISARFAARPRVA